ncbi:membrane dipeptidase [Candidatus Bipolaricaulota bacterium]|nr:membrane dipeptidase [Candidatus Bipolaricaulota bacterium]
MGRPGFFDAHCDTVMKVLDGGEQFLLPEGSKHVSFPGMVAADIRVQVFACYVLSAHFPRREYERACQMIGAVKEMARSTQGALQIALSGDELVQAFNGGPRAGILSLEGADPLGDRAETIREFYGQGIRSLIFAWQDNAFSGTAFGSNTPLTKQGRRLLGLCEELGIVVDVSHLSDLAFEEVAQLSDAPFVATHSNCRALCPSPRNLTDDMIRTLADQGGVIGINLAPAFLDPAYYGEASTLFEKTLQKNLADAEKDRARIQMRAIPRPSINWIARHTLHAMNVGGEDCIGFGGDLDGITQTPEGIDSVTDYAKFVPLLGEAGLSDKQIEKVCYRNFLRVFSTVLATG